MKGSKTRPSFTKEETTSPTASTEGIFITATIDAHKECDVMTADIPNAFIQASLNNLKDGDEKVVMKVTCMLVNLLVKVAPNICGPFVAFKNGRKVLYLQVLKALYGMLQDALLWYKKFRSNLESIGYEFNPCDPCIANKMIDGKQHTIRFHADDIMASHISSLATPRQTIQFLATTTARTRLIPIPFTAKDCAQHECVGQSDHSVQSQSHIEPHLCKRSSIGDIDI